MRDVFSSEDLFCEAVQSSLYIKEPAETANIQLKIIVSLLIAGHRDYARAMLPKILLRIRELDDPKEQAYLMRLFIKQQCEMGLIDDAVNTLPLLNFDTDHKGVALRDVAIALAQNSELAKSLEIAEEIEDLDDYETVLEAVGEGQIKQLRFNDAIQTAAKIEDGEIRSKLLRFIAAAQWKSGYHNEALQTLRNALAMVKNTTEDSVQDRIYVEMVVSFTKVHRIFDALSLAKEIIDPLKRIKAFCSIIVFLQKSGNVSGGKTAANEAIIAARKISDSFHRAKALESVGEALHRIGDTEESKQVFREALASIKTIRNTFSQTQTMTDFGCKLSKIGMPEVAKKVFRLAVALAQTIEGSVFQLLSLSRIVQSQADCLFIEEANHSITIIEEIRDELSASELIDGAFERDLAVSTGSVGLALCRIGNEKATKEGKEYFKKGIDAARKIIDPINRTMALQMLAELFALTTVSVPMPDQAS